MRKEQLEILLVVSLSYYQREQVKLSSLRILVLLVLDIQKLKQSRALKSKSEVVTIGDTEISTVDELIYLGYMLRYDGNETPNLEMRFKKSNTAFCCLRKIWSNTTYLPQELKLRVFNTFVLSVLLYASEVWTLDIKTRRSIRSWYSRKISLITERSYRDECVSPTTDVIQLSGSDAPSG